jgi:hypothetical protein
MPDETKRAHAPYDTTNASAEDVRAVLTMGFESSDKSIKAWLSDIVVPTKDGIKDVAIRMPRGDKTILVWQQDLKEGRAKLPVMSVHRNSAEFHAQKFSPPYLRLRKQFADSGGTRLALIYRPRQFLVEYQATLWAEFKQDAEYVLYQVMTRFSPLAEIRVSDEFMQGNLIMRFGGWTDASEIEAARDTVAKVRYDFSWTAEAWLPLPRKLMPAILGRIQTLQETSGEVLQAQIGMTQVDIRGGL